MRWILLDEIIAIEKGKWAHTRAHIPSPEFNAEFLMIEMMAQTCGLLLGAETQYEQDLVFTKIESAEFLSVPRSEDSLSIEASSENLKPEGAWLDANIQNQGRLIAKGRLLLMNAGRLIPESNRPVTFNDLFMSHYQVLEKLR